ncbi:hypothetical protein PR048_026872, partial [Dryococelus australis]
MLVVLVYWIQDLKKLPLAPILTQAIYKNKCQMKWLLNSDVIARVCLPLPQNRMVKSLALRVHECLSGTILLEKKYTTLLWPILHHKREPPYILVTYRNITSSAVRTTPEIFHNSSHIRASRN